MLPKVKIWRKDLRVYIRTSYSQSWLYLHQAWGLQDKMTIIFCTYKEVKWVTPNYARHMITQFKVYL